MCHYHVPQLLAIVQCTHFSVIKWMNKNTPPDRFFFFHFSFLFCCFYIFGFVIFVVCLVVPDMIVFITFFMYNFLSVLLKNGNRKKNIIFLFDTLTYRNTYFIFEQLQWKRYTEKVKNNTFSLLIAILNKVKFVFFNRNEKLLCIRPNDVPNRL